MTRLGSVLFLALFACSSGSIDHEPPQGFDLSQASYNPQHRIKAVSNSVIEGFVAAQSGIEVNSLWLLDTNCNNEGFAHLKRLRNLYVLTLSGPWMAEPIGSVGGRFVFKTALDDAIVNQIAQIKTLRALNIWYGSLSPHQSELLARLLPKCRVAENLNKI